MSMSTKEQVNKLSVIHAKYENLNKADTILKNIDIIDKKSEYLLRNIKREVDGLLGIVNHNVIYYGLEDFPFSIVVYNNLELVYTKSHNDKVIMYIHAITTKDDCTYGLIHIDEKDNYVFDTESFMDFVVDEESLANVFVKQLLDYTLVDKFYEEMNNLIEEKQTINKFGKEYNESVIDRLHFKSVQAKSRYNAVKKLVGEGVI